jgi:hypothetical protein
MIEKVAELFDVIVTHDWDIVERYPQAVFSPFSGSWASEEEISQQFEKKKLISCIASKNVKTYGHKYRHQLIYYFSHKYKWDLWGSGYRKFHSKVQPLGEYMYNIAIQNGRYDTYFTEILTDPFLLRTIPIFWGSPKVSELFDSRGFYIFDTPQELQLILDNISVEDYAMKKNHIENNYKIAASLRNSDTNLVNAIRSRLPV